ncbi:MAG: O-antigen ligase family protein [bacterium]|nr:O-antigen ligase family protein [bacterium]
MQTENYSIDQSPSDALQRLAIFIWSSLIFFLGTNFRVRANDAPPEFDWLIILQLGLCTFGGLLGLILYQRRTTTGFGTKILGAYILWIPFTAIFSIYSKTVIGYWVLLAGASMLTVGLIACCRNYKDLIRLEKAWLFTVVFILMINTINSLLNPGINAGVTGIYRLGTGWISPSVLAYTCCFAFCVSFLKSDFNSRFILLLIKIGLIIIIIATKTRVPIAICSIVLLVRIVYSQEKIPNPLIIIVLLFSGFVTFVMTTVSLDIPIAVSYFDSFNRGNLGTLKNLTGRLELWKSVLFMLEFNDTNLLFGHGYGVFRFVLQDNGIKLSYLPAHVHNALLEHLFSMGIIGLSLFASMCTYAGKWLIKFKDIMNTTSKEFALRGFTCILAFYLASILAVPLGVKIAPYTILIIFYIVSLDKISEFKYNLRISDEQ